MVVAKTARALLTLRGGTRAQHLSFEATVWLARLDRWVDEVKTEQDEQDEAQRDAIPHEQAERVG